MNHHYDIVAEIRAIVSDTDTPYDSRIAAVARIVAPVTQGQRVSVTAIVSDSGDPTPGTEVPVDSDGDVRVEVSIGEWVDHVYIPVKEIR